MVAPRQSASRPFQVEGHRFAAHSKLCRNPCWRNHESGDAASPTSPSRCHFIRERLPCRHAPQIAAMSEVHRTKRHRRHARTAWRIRLQAHRNREIPPRAKTSPESQCHCPHAPTSGHKNRTPKASLPCVSPRDCKSRRASHALCRACTSTIPTSCFAAFCLVNQDWLEHRCSHCLRQLACRSADTRKNRDSIA